MKNNIDENSVLRFPPSPTGNFHIGNAKTALFNYFLAKKYGAKLKFRLEDTDKERSKKEYEDDIIAGIKWLGMDIDLSSPYRQTEHSGTYQKYLEKIISEGKAYVSKEEVVEEGQRAEVIRLKNPGKEVVFNDLIKGEIKIDTKELGDFVIAKSISEPIYHFAVVVDDFEMGVTHIVRGEDGLYNTPRQILIQEAIGATRPVYAHVPFLLNEDRSKMSKRQLGEMVSVSYYKKMGYLPEALVNFLALTGWHPDGEKEIMSLDEIIASFDISKVQKGGAIFNKEKLLWINKEYLKKLPRERLLSEIRSRLPEKYSDLEKVEKLLPTILDRISIFSDVDKMVEAGELKYFFEKPEYEKAGLIWKTSSEDETKENLKKVLEVIGLVDDFEFTGDKVKEVLWPIAEKVGKGQILWPTRFALSGKDKSPDPFTLIDILGKKETTERLVLAINKLT